MFQLVKSEVRDLTPRLTQEFCEMEASPTERELNPQRVKHLREKADAGLLVTFHWSVANFNGKRLRMNGQHSSTMLAGLDGNFPKGLKVHVDEYEVTDSGDLATLFRQFDDKKSSRSTNDVAGAYQGLHQELRDIPRTSAKLAVDGISWYQRAVEGDASRGGDDAYTRFGDQRVWPFIKWIGEIFSIKTPELKRPAVVGAMYATFISNEKISRTFWDKVARGGDEYNDMAPETVLDNWLKAATDKEKKEILKIKPAHFYQGCVYAWNAYREEKSIKDIRSDTKKGFLTAVG